MENYTEYFKLEFKCEAGGMDWEDYSPDELWESMEDLLCDLRNEITELAFGNEYRIVKIREQVLEIHPESEWLNQIN